MRRTIYFFLVLCCYGLFFNCKKEEEVSVNKNFTDLHDTIITSYEMNGSSSYDLDIDKDDTIDISITVVRTYSSMYPHGNYIQISPKKGNQINFSNYIDTSWYWNPTLPEKIFTYKNVMIPKIYNVGDKIKIDGDFTNDSTMITYYYSPGGANSAYFGDINRQVWINIGYKYIALRKRKENHDKLAWIKLKVISSYGIILNSCNYMETKDEIIID